MSKRLLPREKPAKIRSVIGEDHATHRSPKNCRDKNRCTPSYSAPNKKPASMGGLCSHLWRVTSICHFCARMSKRILPRERVRVTLGSITLKFQRQPNDGCYLQRLLDRDRMQICGARKCRSHRSHRSRVLKIQAKSASYRSLHRDRCKITTDHIDHILRKSLMKTDRHEIAPVTGASTFGKKPTGFLPKAQF
jgi:hypothetical protein